LELFIILFTNNQNYSKSKKLKSQYKFPIFVHIMTIFVNKEARKAGATGIIQTRVWFRLQSSCIRGDGGFERSQNLHR